MSQSGERTEQPTDKRLRDARRRGQVAKSQDLSSALLLIVALAVLWLASAHTAKYLSASMHDHLQYAASFKGELSKETALASLMSGTKTMALVLLPLFVALFLVSTLVGYLQVGSLFAAEAVKPNLNKLNPAESFKQKFFKGRPYIELGKTLLKITITAAVVGMVLYASRRDLIELVRQPAPHAAAFTLKLMFEMGFKVGLAFLLLGVGDFFLQRFLFLKEMRMTKEEVRREYKEQEGDPLFKSMRRQAHREILMQSVMTAVRSADVVVVNPTHLAVALKYDRASMAAPTVVAKGAELMAAQIREIAKESDVPLMRDVPLARALYELEIDSEIPEEMFEAVAVVLRWVYEMAAERGEVSV